MNPSCYERIITINEPYKEIFFQLLSDYPDSYNAFTVGEIYTVNKELQKIIEDLSSITQDKDIYYALFADVLNYRVGIKPNVYFNLFEKVLSNHILLQHIINNKGINSGFLSFIQVVGQKIIDLQTLMKNKQNYLALEKYKEILDICNNAGIELNLNDERFIEEVERRLPFHQGIYTSAYFRKILLTQKYNVDTMETDSFVYKESPYLPGIYLQKILYDMMHDYYLSTGAFYRQYNNEYAFYIFDGLTVVSYKYDDVPNIALCNDNLILMWQDRDFWAKVFDKSRSFSKKCFSVLNNGTKEQYRVKPLSLKKEMFNELGKSVIYVPEGCVGEALYQNITFLGEDINNMIARRFNVGANKKQSEVLTTDGNFFFKDPSRIDELNVKEPDKYVYFKSIKEKDASGRKKVISSLQYHAKKNPKKPSFAQTKSEVYFTGPELRGPVRLQYKDD